MFFLGRHNTYFDPQGISEKMSDSDYFELSSESAPFLGQIPGTCNAR